MPYGLNETYNGLNFQVLSDSMKKGDYDEQLRKEEAKSVSQKSHNTSHQVLLHSFAC